MHMRMRMHDSLPHYLYTYLPTPRPQILGNFSLERSIAAAATPPPPPCMRTSTIWRRTLSRY